MRQTNKQKTPTTKKRGIKKPETPNKTISPITIDKRFIEINEYDAELAQKNKRLWLFVLFFSLILISGWFFILKTNIQKQSISLSFDNLKQEINTTLANFDLQLEANKQSSVLAAENITAIKDNIEEQIKNNPDPSFWPNHDFSKLNISLKYPINWQIISDDATTIIISDQTASTTDHATISISLLNNKNNATLLTWIDRNENLDDYKLENQVFKFSTNTPDVISYIPQTKKDDQLNKYYFLSIDKKIIKIEVKASGLPDIYLPLTTAIIQTIKIN